MERLAQLKRVHCVGIGGSGISAIARVLLEQGYQVSGSDLNLSPAAQSLAAAGAMVWAGHDATHVGDVDALLVSSAISQDNPEIGEARRRGIPIYKRADWMGHMMAGKVGVAIAGTAGKTTTTGMLVWILSEAGCDPTFVVGGVIEGLDTNAHAGGGPHFVVEADEYDRMFLGLLPTVAAVTHLEHDHPDCFPTYADMQAAFVDFLALVPADGLIVGCGDHPTLAALLAQTHHAPVQTCGLKAGNDWQARELHSHCLGGHDLQVYHDSAQWGRVQIRLPGLHNVQNALIAIAIAHWLGVEPHAIRRAVSTFPGIERRFQVRGQVGQIVVIDDYAHHPTKIRATLSAARQRYGGRPLWAVFQPHTYSRTRALWAEFAASFDQADHVVVLDVYAAREKDTLGVRASDLAADMVHPDAHYAASLQDAAADIVSRVEPNAVVITLSAGDGNIVADLVLDRLQKAST